MGCIYVYFEYTACHYSCQPQAFRDYDAALSWLKKCFEEAKGEANEIDEAELTEFEEVGDDGFLAQAFVNDDADCWSGEVWRVAVK
ncbi:MAG: hypothetical protein WCJ02_14145 [bacterium]